MKAKNKTKKQLENEIAELKIKRAERNLFYMLDRWKCNRTRSERREIEKVINSLPGGVVIIGDAYKIRFHNKWMNKRFGNIDGKTCYRAFAGKEKPCKGCMIQKAITEKILEKGEIIAKNGRYYSLIAAPIGKYYGESSGIELITDITETKQMENEMVHHQKRYQDLIDSLNVGVYQTEATPDGMFKEVNPALISMFGASSREELLGHSVSDFYCDPDRRSEIIKKALKTGSVIDEKVEFKTIDGRRFWASLSLTKKEDDKGILLNGIIEDIRTRKKWEEKLFNQSFHDELTGVYNRRGFFELTEQQVKVAKRDKKSITIFYIDLDDFKKINDAFGHQEGDKALINTVLILKNTFRESDIIARIGGDEFAVFAKGLSGKDFTIVINRIRLNLTDHNKENLCPYSLSMSVGTAWRNWDENVSMEELLEQSDRDMYKKKKCEQEFISYEKISS